jgi:hypothetical protein
MPHPYGGSKSRDVVKGWACCSLVPLFQKRTPIEVDNLESDLTFTLSGGRPIPHEKMADGSRKRLVTLLVVLAASAWRDTH